MRKTDYPSADTYLDGLEITQQSFVELIPRFNDNPKALLILDPPYLFFSSTKSEFIRFLDYLVGAKKENWQAFENAKRISIEASASYSGRYEDNLVFKF